MGPDGDRTPDCAVREQTPHALQSGVKTELVAYQNAASAAPHGLLERSDAVPGVRDGLLQEQVAACLSSRDGDLQMQGSRV